LAQGSDHDEFFDQARSLARLREPSFCPHLSPPIRDSALAGQARQALSNFERCTFLGKKPELAIDCIRLSALAASDVKSVALQMVRFPFVGQLNVKNALQATNQPGIDDRKEDFDAITQVASHEVGAAEINFLGSPVPEIVDAAML
jgi:hypothetical protein